ARVFFVRKHANNRRHYVTIGEDGTAGLTVVRAREAAKKVIVAIREGHTPAEQRARDRAMPRVSDFAASWLQEHVNAKLKFSTARLYSSTLRSIILPAIGSIRVGQLTADDVSRMHLRARSTPYAANRAVAIVSKMMHFAERKGLRPRNANPARG